MHLLFCAYKQTMSKSENTNIYIYIGGDKHWCYDVTKFNISRLIYNYQEFDAGSSGADCNRGRYEVMKFNVSK